jgi:hypothetical protein
VIGRVARPATFAGEITRLGETPERAADADGSRTTLSRRRALLVAGALAGVLGVGWLADALAGLPLRARTAGTGELEAGAFEVALTLAPTAPVAGADTGVTVAVHDLAGQRVAPARFYGALLMPAMGMYPVEPAWEPLTLGQYRAVVAFPMAGDWSLVVTLTDASGRASTTQFVISVR